MHSICIHYVTSVTKLQVSLAETLDMYYVDPYSLPDKELSCGVVAEYVNVSSRKVRLLFVC